MQDNLRIIGISVMYVLLISFNKFPLDVIHS